MQIHSVGKCVLPPSTFLFYFPSSWPFAHSAKLIVVFFVICGPIMEEGQQMSRIGWYDEREKWKIGNGKKCGNETGISPPNNSSRISSDWTSKAAAAPGVLWCKSTQLRTNGFKWNCARTRWSPRYGYGEINLGTKGKQNNGCAAITDCVVFGDSFVLSLWFPHFLSLPIFLHLYSQIRTQGRWDKGRGLEFPAAYMLEYWRESLGRWARYKNGHGNEVRRKGNQGINGWIDG